MVDTEQEARRADLGNLWFLIDIPLFIDGTSIRQLFDAMVRPEWEPVSRIKTSSDGNTLSVGVNAKAEGKAKIPLFLTGNASGGIKSELKNESLEANATNEQTNRSPEMSLEKIVNRYLTHFPERLLRLSDNPEELKDFNDTALNWNRAEELLDAPGMRPLIVLDLPARTKILPMFAETSLGKALELHKPLAKRLKIDKILKPLPSRKDNNYEAGAIEHWDNFARNFSSMEAIRCVESVHSRLHWAAFRAWPAGKEGVMPLHLSILPYGNYANGTFAYQFIRRAENFGIRLIGTLKKGRDINVLGIYER